MTPNLRFNKKMTSHLIKSSPKDDVKLNSSTVKWHLDNDDDIVYGSYHQTLLNRSVFILQKVNGIYRLVASNTNDNFGIYIIDNIDKYLDYIGAELLEFVDGREASDLIKTSQVLPNTGVIIIREDKIFVYDHTDY